MVCAQVSPAVQCVAGVEFTCVRREDGADGDGVVVHCMKWGLIPSFTKKTEKPDHHKMVIVVTFVVDAFQ